MGSHTEHRLDTPVRRLFAVTPDPRPRKPVDAAVGISGQDVSAPGRANRESRLRSR
jgi:hypothetical protein